MSSSPANAHHSPSPVQAGPSRPGWWWRLTALVRRRTRPRGKASRRRTRPVIRQLVWARRLSQAGFLLLLLWLLLRTTFRGSFAAGDAPVRVGLPVEGFLLADPFVALMTVLSTRALYRGLAWAGLVLLLTVLLGRVFCGWLCPFGTLHHLVGWLFPSARGNNERRIAHNRTHPVRQRVKYYLLYAALAAAVTGSAIGGMLDPICIAVRSIGLGLLPAAQYVAGAASGWLGTTELSDLQHGSDAASDFLAATVWQSQQHYYHQGWLISVALCAVLVMNCFIPRFWCRVLCPLGALLGLLSRWALVGMEKDHAKCTDCDLCLPHCQGADSPEGGVKWRQDECHMCFNCEAACPEDVIAFRWLPGLKSRSATPDTGRRTALASVAAGAALLPIARVADALDANYDERLIRPPGAVDERAFLERCVRCAECMKVCPNNALHPAFFEAGIEGLWTPILIARIGYCEHSCVLCGEVCPTGAIQKISEADKLGIGRKPIAIGTAFFDRGRCLPWAMGTPCMVCEEFCPTSPKAIWVEPVELPKRSSKPGPDGAPAPMTTVQVKRPHLDPELCIGCGACEKACPVQDKPAVYVTNVGESRSRSNVILLETGSYDQRS